MVFYALDDSHVTDLLNQGLTHVGEAVCARWRQPHGSARSGAPGDAHAHADEACCGGCAPAPAPRSTAARARGALAGVAAALLAAGCVLRSHVGAPGLDRRPFPRGRHRGQRVPGAAGLGLACAAARSTSTR